MNRTRRAIITMFVVVLAAVIRLQPAIAGPVADFERMLRDAYSDYRVALAQTNTKSAEGSLKAIAALATKWSALSARYGAAAPPQYADDPQFAAVLASVARTVEHAGNEARAGDLAKAHDTLEGIRDTLAALRLRNGIVTISDRMNALHAHMEHMLTKGYDGFSAVGMSELREDTAVLAYLGEEVKTFPTPEATAPDYAPALRGLLDAIAALQRAAREGDAGANKAALAKVKPAYARLFIKFG